MKLTTSLVASLLASVAMARPQRAMDEGDPLPQTSRITAFVVDDKGNPSVECWEISNIVDDSQQTQQIQRADGSKATAYSTSISRKSDFEGIDILTWPSLVDIWPPSGSSVHAENFDLSNTFNLFSVQGGLINFNFYAARFGATDDDDEVETHIFNLENGDDWFYFEDEYTGSSLARSAHATPYPFSISTVSATETELLRLRYNSQPKHTVLHKGGCHFTGISTPADSSSRGGRTSREHSPLTVQVNIGEDL
jgi:hypothetical protein